MKTFYYVNPVDVTDISGPYDEGRSYTYPDGRTFLVGKAEPQWDVYESIPFTDPVPRYYEDGPVTTAFQGAVNDPAARVIENRVDTQLPIAELYEVKRQEIFNYDSLVRYNAVDTSLSVNWWLIVTQPATTELLIIAVGSNSRQIAGAGWPAGANRPLVGIYNAATGDSRRYAITEQATWDTLEVEWFQHVQATGNATDASRSALDVSYDDGNGVWQAVADHDPADPAWGYPPTVDPAELGAATF